jgi:hypothetical protein
MSFAFWASDQVNSPFRSPEPIQLETRSDPNSPRYHSVRAKCGIKDMNNPMSAPQAITCVLFVSCLSPVLAVAEYILAFCIMSLCGDQEGAFRILPMGHPGQRWDPFIAGIVLTSNVLLSFKAYDRFLRILDRSRSRQIVEVQACLKGGGPTPVDELIEVDLPGKYHRDRLISGVLTLALTLVMLMFFPEYLRTSFSRACMRGLSLIAIGHLVAIWMRGVEQVRSNEQEIQGYSSPFAFRRNSCLWAEIETCEIMTHFDIWGQSSIRPVFQDQSGATLMRLDLSGVEPADRDRLLKYIKARLPRTQVDLQEFD